METTIMTNANLFTVSAPTATIWRVDPARSKAGFSVDDRLLLLVKTTVNGHFSDISGAITLDERDLTRSRAELTFGAARPDTGNAQGDKHLKSAAFFDVASYPEGTFTSRSVEAVASTAGGYRAVGDLTVRGVTRSITLDIQYAAPRPHADERRIRLIGTTTVSRRDFGMTWRSLVGRPADEVGLRIALEATPAPEQPRRVQLIREDRWVPIHQEEIP